MQGGGVLHLVLVPCGVLCGLMTSFISTSSSIGSEAMKEEDGTAREGIAGDGGGERICRLAEAGVTGTVVLHVPQILLAGAPPKV